ncbi:MAG: molybdate ABC transporter substrate-binding protein [Xenococcaceae cyanobacterium]
MTRRYILIFLSGMLLSFFLSFRLKPAIFSPSAQAENNASLTVSAAASLKDALGEIQQLDRQKKASVRISYNFGSSGSLQQQIEQGAPVDIFISAAAKQMNALEKKNLLLPDTRQDLLTNQMVLITTKEHLDINKVEDLANSSVNRIALGEPKSVPAGQYAEEILNFYKISDRVRPKLIYAKDVRQVLSYVETGNVDAGFVYLSDAKQSKKIRIASTAPKESHRPIAYPIAVLKDSKNPQAAEEFIKFLATPQVKKIFEQYGFGIQQPSVEGTGNRKQRN